MNNEYFTLDTTEYNKYVAKKDINIECNIMISGINVKSTIVSDINNTAYLDIYINGTIDHTISNMNAQSHPSFILPSNIYEKEIKKGDMISFYTRTKTNDSGTYANPSIMCYVK